MDKVSIRQAGNQDLSSLYSMLPLLGKADDPGYFERCLELQLENKRMVFIVEQGGVDAGYAILNWIPKYPPFKVHNIPEIQDLNILPQYRRNGLATQLIKFCEMRAKEKGFVQMGIGVGLHSSYGPAQRLYYKLGYCPDGQGINYDRKPIAYGEFKPVDDDLCLMLYKDL